MKHFFLPVCLVLLLLSCGKKNDNVVLIDPDDAVEAVLTDVACDIRIIPLKSDEPMMKSTWFVFYDDYFFGTTMDFDYTFKYLNVFDKEGNLLGKIDRVGRGPGEYLGLANFFFDPQTKVLKLFDISDEQAKITSYQLPGLEYLGADKWFMRMLRMDQLVAMGDGRFLFQAHRSDESEQDLRILTFDESNNVSGMVDLGTVGSNEIAPTFYCAHFTNYKNPLVAFFGYNNRICRIEGDSLVDEFCFTFGPKGLPQSFADNQDRVTSYMIINSEFEMYMQQDCAIQYDVPVKNGDVLSFCYQRDSNDEEKRYLHYYVTDGKKSANYSKLNIPGIKMKPQLIGTHGTSYVMELPDVLEIDESVPMSELGQQIVDAYKNQNDNNPILLEFSFK